MLETSTVLHTDSVVSTGEAKGLEQIAGTQTRQCFLQAQSTCTSIWS